MNTTPENSRKTGELDDAYIHLEDLSAANIEWANTNSAATVERFSGPKFSERQEQLDAILSSKDHLIAAVKYGDYAYDFYIDGDHPRGVLRRAPFADYLAFVSPETEPEWETVLDVDALCKTEEQSWVFGGIELLFPDYEQALITLHPGGSDSNVVREFNVKTKEFRDSADAFIKPESKGSMNWVDGDTVVIEADFGENSVTASGYPISARLWKRGEKLDDAVEIIHGEYDDVLVGAYYDHTPGYEKLTAVRSVDFHTHQLWDVDLAALRAGKEAEKREYKLPYSASVGTVRDWAIVDLRYAWELGDQVYPAGALLTVPLGKAISEITTDDVHVLFTPTETSSLLARSSVRSGLIFSTLENVRQHFWYAQLTDNSWKITELCPDIPEFSTVSIAPVDSYESDDIWLTSAGFLQPTTLFHGSVSAAGIDVHKLRSTPKRFETAGLAVRQRWATSKDGTKIPYFVVGPEDVLNGGRPARTLLDAYGGFEVSRLPAYISTYGKVWLEKGYVYALANIRGGGEFGPRWHQAALKDKRHKAYEDHAAVAQDLVASGITTVPQLAATGGSNGGLLMGNMYTTYPELYGAIVCRVPLLDMKRFSHLLAGASWMAEYGNPDTADWDYIQRYSPYHNIGDGPYPPILITTSTRDDRVHPGHARKFFQKLHDAGFETYYYENTEGGHAGAADIKQTAFVTALIFSYLDQVLAD